MICIEQLEMHFGPKLLFAHVDLQLFPGNRYGLTGANGSGKSTFLKVMSRQENPTSGQIRFPNQIKIGFLEQDHFKYDNMTLLDSVLSGRAKLFQSHQRIQELLNHEHFDDSSSEEYSHLVELYEREGGYSAESEAAKLLEGLGLPNDRHDKLMSTLSGGYKLRVLLARVLFSEPDILLLDEPTNHLDLYSIRWLELYLKKFPGVLVMTTHDREFINAVSSHILELDYGSIQCYKGNYEQYLVQHEEQKRLRESNIEKSEKKREELQKFVDRFRAKASKARQAQSKEKMIDKLEDDIKDNEMQKSSRCPPGIVFKQERPSGAIPLVVDNLCKSYGPQKVLHNVSFELNRGDRLAVLGPNGIGKSTLLGIITGNLAADAGTYKHGHALNLAYLPQNLDAQFTEKNTVLNWLTSFYKTTGESQIRKTLGRMLFSGDDVHKSVMTLSGGEKARLILSRIMLSGCNMIVLDEPTNHLDMEAIDQLTEALKEYDGTLVFVSHNRWFVKQLATRIVELSAEGARMIEGGYDYFLTQATDHLERNLSLKNRQGEKTDPPQPIAVPKAPSMSEDERKQLKKKLSAHEKDIQRHEEKLADLHEQMANPEFHAQKSVAEQESIYKTSAQVQADLDQAYKEWDKISSLLESGNQPV